MFKLPESARVSTRSGSVWKSCVRCAVLFPAAPDADRCRDCSDLLALASTRTALAFLVGYYRDAGAVPVEVVELLGRLVDTPGAGDAQVDRSLGVDPVERPRRFAVVRGVA